MSSPLSLSVVIPTFNRASLLPRAIDSALGQLRRGDEVIVVDDGSTDSTASILEAYGDRIRVVRGPRAGAGAARNLGIAAARGDLIAFLDSDDEWFEGKTELQRTLFEAQPEIHYSFGEMACTFSDGSVARKHLWTWHRDPRPWAEIAPGHRFSELAPLPAGVDDFSVHVGDFFHDLSRRLYVLTSSYMVRRGAVGDSLRFEEGVPLYEDWACFGRVARRGKGAFFDRELAWQHGEAEERLSDGGTIQRCEVHLMLLETIWASDPEYLAEHGDELRQLESEILDRLAGSQIVMGDLRKASATLSRMESPPPALLLLTRLPSRLVRLLLLARRILARGHVSRR